MRDGHVAATTTLVHKRPSTQYGTNVSRHFHALTSVRDLRHVRASLAELQNF